MRAMCSLEKQWHIFHSAARSELAQSSLKVILGSTAAARSEGRKSRSWRAYYRRFAELLAALLCPACPATARCTAAKHHDHRDHSGHRLELLTVGAVMPRARAPLL